MTYLLAIDQGTTGTTALLVDSKIRILAKVNREFRQYYPKPGWVEHDAEEIWQSTVKTISQVIKKAKIKSSQIAAIGVTNQRETTILWDKNTGKPIHRAIVWQDRRTADFCASLKRKKGISESVRRKTGLVLDPYFSATKIRWILQKTKKRSALRFGTVDSWLVWKLTRGKVHVTDVTNASRTLLMNLKTLRWDPELLKLFQIPKTILPNIRSCSEIYGTTEGVKGLPDGIPIAGMAGDQQAALFGQACFAPGEAKCTYGTGSFLLMNVGNKPVFSKSGLLTSVAWKIGKEKIYALEGSAFIAGAGVQWLRDELKIISSSSEVEKLAKTVSDHGGVHFVLALAGLGAPHWEPQARGVLCGLTRGSSRGHIARAVLEGIAFSQFDILRAMQKDSGKRLKMLKVDGGATVNDLLMQFQSDILKTPLIRPKVIETTALGAAFLAGLAVGFWKDKKEIQKRLRIDKRFFPKMSERERKERIFYWQKAVERTMIV